MSQVSGSGLIGCRPPGRGGLARGVSHLLVAADALSPDRWGGSQIAVCGAQVHSANASTAETGTDPRYCPACVRAAVHWIATR